MSMDHTGETGDEIEIEAVELGTEIEPVDDEIAIEAELVDDDDDEDAEVDEVEDVQVDSEPTVAVGDDDVENFDDDEEESELVDSGVHASDDAVDDQRVGARYRHPAAAAALAKRVAMDRSARIAVGSLVLVAFLFLFVFPTRSYVAQQRQVNDARHSVQVLREQNAKLAREAQRLQTDREIEKLARSQFNMVFEGEEAYNVVPPNGSPTTTTEP
jgi:cell division protein FtsB